MRGGGTRAARRSMKTRGSKTSWLDKDDDIANALVVIVQDDDARSRVRAAAVCALALGRYEAHTPMVQAFCQAEGVPEVLSRAADSALLVLQGADLSALRESVVAACGDIIERERMFVDQPSLSLAR